MTLAPVIRICLYGTGAVMLAVSVFYATRSGQPIAAPWGLPWSLGCVGALLLLLGRMLAWRDSLARQRARKLLQRGTRLQAEVREITANRKNPLKPRAPWRIVAQWKDPVTADFHVFLSDKLPSDPAPHMRGAFVSVYIDGQNPRRYHMDTSFLPNTSV